MADFTEKNRQYFDKLASSYKDDFGKVLRALAQQVQDRRLWISNNWTDTNTGSGQEIKMLDYACGPGNISMALEPFVTKVVGVDLSDNMVDEFNKNAREAGLSDKMNARKGDLLADSVEPEFSGPEFNDFDVVAVSMALHHFSAPDMALKRLAQRLKQGGAFLIIDLVPEGQTFHETHPELVEAAATIGKHGFTMDEMKNLFQDAGLNVGFDYQVVEEPMVFTKNGKTIQKTVFIARGQRA